MFRFSLGSLLFLVLFIGVACAALVNNNRVWTGIAATGAFLTIGGLTAAACIWKEGQRAAALTLAIFAWFYFFVTFADFFSFLVEKSPTTKVLNWLGEWLPKFDSHGFNVFDGRDGDFMDTGHFLTIVFLGWLGSIVGRFLYACRRERAENPPVRE